MYAINSKKLPFKYPLNNFLFTVREEVPESVRWEEAFLLNFRFNFRPFDALLLPYARFILPRNALARKLKVHEPRVGDRETLRGNTYHVGFLPKYLQPNMAGFRAVVRGKERKEWRMFSQTFSHDFHPFQEMNYTSGAQLETDLPKLLGKTFWVV